MNGDIISRLLMHKNLKHNPLGSGVNGNVFSLEIEGSPWAWALKVVSLSNHQLTPAWRDEVWTRIQREWQNSVRPHPYSIHVFDRSVHEERGCIRLLTTLCNGGDLAQMIVRQRAAGHHFFPEELILHILAQIILALEHIHSENILHRDLKPSNVYIDTIPPSRSFRVMIGDFGSAKITQGDSSSGTHTRVGTPLNMAPEVISHLRYGKSCDIWSVGILLIELCTLSAPYEITSNSSEELMGKINRLEYKPIPSVYSRELRDLVSVMLSLDPVQRPTANQLLRCPYLRPYFASAFQTSEIPLPLVTALQLPRNQREQEKELLNVGCCGLREATQRSLLDQIQRTDPDQRREFHEAYLSSPLVTGFTLPRVT